MENVFYVKKKKVITLINQVRIVIQNVETQYLLMMLRNVTMVIILMEMDVLQNVSKKNYINANRIYVLFQHYQFQI